MSTGSHIQARRHEGRPHLAAFARLAFTLAIPTRREGSVGLLVSVMAVVALAASPAPVSAAPCPERDGCEEWVVRYDGPASGDDGAVAVAVTEDTIFVASNSAGGESGQDYLLLAYDRAGTLRWSARYEGPGTGFDVSDRVQAMAVSDDGSRVFLTGAGSSPGSPFTDISTVAFDGATGEMLWESHYAGEAGRHDQGFGIGLAPGTGTVVVVGMETVFNGTGGLEVDAVALALDPGTGERLWRTPYAGSRSAQDVLRRVAFAPDGETVYAIGEAAVPGSGSFPYDFLTLALDARSGATRWEARYDSGAEDYDGAFGLAVAPDGGRVFVSGQSRGLAGDLGGTDAATLAYDASDGSEMWAVRHNGTGDGFDAARDAAVTPDGSKVLISGVQDVKGTGYDYLTAAYATQTGEPLWSAAYAGPADEGVDNGSVLDLRGDEVYVIGTSQNLEVDLDAATVAYDVRTGIELWRARHATPPVGPYRDAPADVAASPDGSQVVVVGQSSVEGQGMDLATIAYTAGRDGVPILGALSARVAGSDVEVEGSVRFVGGPVTGAPDDPADASVPLRESGAELSSASIRYDPVSASLLVRLAVPGLSEVAGGSPAVLYGLEMSVDGVSYEVRGGSRADDAGGGRSFALFRCAAACEEVASLEGTVDAGDGVVRTTVPLAAMDASEGALLRAVRAYSATGEMSAGALVELDSVVLPDATIPSRSVAVGIAPAESDPEDVSLVAVPVKEDGTFSARLPAPEDPSQHAAWARACLGSRCAMASAPVPPAS